MAVPGLGDEPAEGLRIPLAAAGEQQAGATLAGVGAARSPMT
jgi:hypothetical protein